MYDIYLHAIILLPFVNFVRFKPSVTLTMFVQKISRCPEGTEATAGHVQGCTEGTKRQSGGRLFLISLTG